MYRSRTGSILDNRISLAGMYWSRTGSILDILIWSLELACAGAAVLILVAGLAAAWRGPRLPWRADLRAWPQLVVLAGLTLLFVMIGRGLALFDDYWHIPLISVMAAGDIPPHFYLDPTQPMAYHYGLQVLAARSEE